MRSLNQEKESGALPTSPLQYKVAECRFKDIRHIFEQYHYKGGHMGGGISFCLALLHGANIVGGAVIGKPRWQSRYPGCVEIRRMACLDECPKNTESYFLGKIIWWIRKQQIATCVLSYADMSVGHEGIIYKASNFTLVGDTAPGVHVWWKGKRYHPRSLSINRPYSFALREAIKTGEARKEIGLPKKIYMYVL